MDNLDYYRYTLTVEVDGPGDSKTELGVITAQLPAQMKGTDVLDGLGSMLHAAADQLNARDKPVLRSRSVPPGWTCPAVSIIHDYQCLIDRLAANTAGTWRGTQAVNENAL